MSDVYSALVTSTNQGIMYSGGERTRPIDTIVIHHNATTNKDVAMNTWLVSSGNQTSAHYEVTGSEIIGCVGENMIAYHSGGTGGVDVPSIPDINNRSIGIEHVNSTGAPDWQVADSTLHQSARLIADICKRYGLPINRNTIKLHREITATACPGGLDIDKLIQYAQEEDGQEPTNQVLPDQNDVQKMLATHLVQWNGKVFKADKFEKYAGIWQIISYEVAGGDDATFKLNGIPLAYVDRVNDPDQTKFNTGDTFRFNPDVMDIIAGDTASNGVRINPTNNPSNSELYSFWVSATTALEA